MGWGTWLWPAGMDTGAYGYGWHDMGCGDMHLAVVKVRYLAVVMHTAVTPVANWTFNNLG